MPRCVLVRRLVVSCSAVAFLCSLSTTSGAQSAPRTFKAAFYNIKSGIGQVGLAGSFPFAGANNCGDPARPLNAWSAGAVQAELRARLASDPSAVVLGLAEA